MNETQEPSLVGASSTLPAPGDVQEGDYVLLHDEFRAVVLGYNGVGAGVAAYTVQLLQDASKDPRYFPHPAHIGAVLVAGRSFMKKL